MELFLLMIVESYKSDNAFIVAFGQGLILLAVARLCC